MGESTASYFHTPGVHRRIHDAFPEVRLLASLRNPADRAFSHHRYSFQVTGRLSIYPTFEDALDASDELLELGRYGAHLSRWITLFPREQMHLVLFDDIRSDPQGVATGAYRFLELRDDGFHTDRALERRHATGSWGIQLARPRLYRVAILAWERMKRIPGLNRLLLSSGLPGTIRRRLRRGAQRVEAPASLDAMTLAPETRQRIIETMRTDIELLQEILGRDLTSWLSDGKT